SAMNGDACFMLTSTGHPVRAERAVAWARVISVRGEPLIARYRCASSSSASGEGGRPPRMCLKYGAMSPSVAGLPYAMHRMPVDGSRDIGRHPGMNCLDEQLKVGNTRVGK